VIRIRLTRNEWWYEPEQPLGPEGGFGAVYEGRGSNDELVAVKRLSLSADDLAHREMTVADDLIDRQLEWVIPMLDAGQDAESEAYFVVMARAEKSLQQDIGSGRTFSEPDAIDVLLSIVSGLREVQHIVHRDLKPGNILLHEGAWKIADFGIARFVEESTSLRTLRDFLSWPYAAPEQWQAETATNATDIYALGCIAHALISGKPPFPGPRAEDYKRQHLEETPPQLESVSPRLAALVSMALRKAPQSRPTLERVHRLLEAIGRDERESTGSSALAAAGARVAEIEAAEEAAKISTEEARTKRRRTAQDALERLTLLMRDLTLRVQENAPLARGSSNTIELGEGQLGWEITHEYFEPDAFAKSGWDVYAGARFWVAQSRGDYRGRSACLWYTEIGTGEDLRWYEVAYMQNALIPAPSPISPTAIDPDDADAATGPAVTIYQIASGPLPIDDEDFEAFCDRWMERLALASARQLTRPSRLPEQ